MSHPRIVVSGATTALTRRTVLRKAFLAPWHPEVQHIVHYALAYAQRELDVAVHHTALVPSHHHTSVTPTHDNLPAFTELLHRDISCALHALLCRERYDAPRELFDDRQTHMMRLVDAPAQAEHLVYEHLNAVAAGLVKRPEHMPGRVIEFRHWKTGYIEVDRPSVYFSSRRPDRLRLWLTPPPLLSQAFDGDVDRLVYHMERLTNAGLLAIRDERNGRPVMGARDLTRLHPWSEPRTLRETGGRRVPTFRIGASGAVGTQLRVMAARETGQFRGGHHQARVARREGQATAVFPFGTYAMRVHHGATVAPAPHDEAIVTGRGPLLCDVKAELAKPDRDRTAVVDASKDLLTAVREAVTARASELIDAEDAGPYESAVTRTSPAGRAEDDPPAALVVRHRFDRRRDTRDDAITARRVVTLRDRRRGRPPGSTRHGSDPPV